MLFFRFKEIKTRKHYLGHAGTKGKTKGYTKGNTKGNAKGNTKGNIKVHTKDNTKERRRPRESDNLAFPVLQLPVPFWETK